MLYQKVIKVAVGLIITDIIVAAGEVLYEKIQNKIKYQKAVAEYESTMQDLNKVIQQVEDYYKGLVPLSEITGNPNDNTYYTPHTNSESIKKVAKTRAKKIKATIAPEEKITKKRISKSSPPKE